MKLIVQITRVLVGGLFIFSGLVKAIDPLGLTYKMEEFFEVWARENYLPALMNWLSGHAFTFSIIMITLEVALGVALLVGWARRLTLNLLLVLMLFFTFLTSYVLFSGKIRACGCFGDCIPLTPVQTFTKDIILLLLLGILFWGRQYIQPLFKRNMPLWFVMIATALTLYLQAHVIIHLPLADCLPYKPGNNILELRKMPADAVPDKYEYSFIYEKNGEQKAFTAAALPDSTWSFVDRKQTLVEKGRNNIPVINDFTLRDADGIDVTETVLNQPEYYLFFIKAFEKNEIKWLDDFKKLATYAKKQNKPLGIVTSIPQEAGQFFNNFNGLNLPVYTCDVTAIKTAARANPALLVMQGPVVKAKYSWADLDEVFEP
ncbi:MAG TPA: DoxX family membrane protein [Ferruginibacter sp.]|nr:DoxX family membrane protein [Ferruginibacter sp.]HMP21529.1 DoxX family membrane protein [Ferruginibacter sp.]